MFAGVFLVGCRGWGCAYELVACRCVGFGLLVLCLCGFAVVCLLEFCIGVSGLLIALVVLLFCVCFATLILLLVVNSVVVVHSLPLE